MKTRTLSALALAALIAACAAPGGCPANDPAACAGMSDGYGISADDKRKAGELYDRFDGDGGLPIVREGLY